MSEMIISGYTVLVDEDLRAELGRFNWYLYGRSRGKPYFCTRVAGKKVALHRYIVSAKDGGCVDHINHNTLDNRRENLRITTTQGNNINQPMRKDNKSGYKGVSYHSATRKWSADIRRDGIRHHIGLFESAEMAHLAYCAEVEARVRSDSISALLEQEG